jgi:hypothetical protein
LLCDWCDEPIVEECGDYTVVFRRVVVGGKLFRLGHVRWNEEYFHDYCFEDGTRGEDVRENEQGELEIL